MLRSKTEYTQEEANKIRSLLQQKIGKDSDEQKRIRDSIRELDFYITDFKKSSIPFTREDFDDLVSRGRIKKPSFIELLINKLNLKT